MCKKSDERLAPATQKKTRKTEKANFMSLETKKENFLFYQKESLTFDYIYLLIT
jgi:hypothetical protein